MASPANTTGFRTKRIVDQAEIGQERTTGAVYENRGY